MVLLFSRTLSHRIRRLIQGSDMQTIKVGSVPVRVVFAEMEDFGEWAYTASPEIRINKDLCPQVKACTLLHEILHAVCDVYGVRLAERDVLTLEQGLAQVCVDNPEVVLEWLKGMLGIDGKI